MTDQQRPDDDVEGHAKAKLDAADEVEGHSRRFNSDAEGTEESDDDVEGHKRQYAQEEGSVDDVAGHASRPSLDDEDDVEGHSPARRPL